MSLYFAGAICEGWICAPLAVLVIVAFCILFGVVLSVPLYLLFKYYEAHKAGDAVKAKSIKKKSIGLLVFIILAIIIGNIVNQIYLALKK